MELCRCPWVVNTALKRLGAFLGCQTDQSYQKRQTRRMSITRPSAPNGPYCFKSSSQLMRTAALLYLAESSRSLEDMSPVEEACQHIPVTLSFVWLCRCVRTHLFQRVTSVQQVFDVFCHDLGDILELVIQSTKVARRSGVLVCLLRPLDEAIKLGVCVWPELGVEVGFALIRGLEFGANVFEIR